MMLYLCEKRQVMEQQEEMFALVESYQQSSQSQKEFCQEQGIKPSTFSYWIKKKRLSEKPSVGFIKIDTTPALEENHLEILYPNGVRLKIKEKDLSVISALIRLY